LFVSFAVYRKIQENGVVFRELFFSFPLRGFQDVESYETKKKLQTNCKNIMHPLHDCFHFYLTGIILIYTGNLKNIKRRYFFNSCISSNSWKV